MDVARLGFEVDTSDLTTAEKSLEKLVPAAAKAETAADNLTNTFIGLSGGANKFAFDLDKAATGTSKFTTNNLKASTSIGAISAATTSASSKLTGLDGSIGGVAAAVAAMNTQFNLSEKELNDFASAANRTKVANDNVAKSMRAMGATAGQLQSNTTNLIAQFQDIGVTASMGMNPMMIGMQQGAQIAAVMQNAVGQQGLAGALGQLGKSFLSVLGPVTFLSIAFTGLLAAAIQFIDWTATAKSVLLFLADNMETLGMAAMALGVTLGIAFGPQIIGSVLALTKAIGVGLVGAVVSATKAMVAFALANPFGALVIAIGAVLAAAYVFRDEVTRILGFDLISAVKDGANFLISGMVGAYNTIKRTWSDLPAALGDAAYMAVNAALRAINGLINGSVNAINGLIDMIPEFMRPGKIGAFSGFGEIANPFAGALEGVSKIAVEEIGKVQGRDWVGGFIDGAKGLMSKASDALRGFANNLGLETEDGKKDKTGRDKRDPNYGKTDPATLMALQEQMRLNEAFREAISIQMDLGVITENVFDSMVNRAKDVTSEVAKYLREVDQFSRDTVKGIFTSFRDNLMEGKTIWESFADTAIRALNRISDRLFDMLLDMAMDSNGGGLLGGIASAIGGLFGGVKANAKGNAFGAGGVTAFANGGVVDSPTLFGFGGGKKGLMGEAGEEGILPLKRGPDGKLGVQAHGGGGREIVLRVIGEEGPMFRPTIEAVSQDKAVTVVQAGLEAFNNSLPDRVQQIAGDERLR